MGIRSFVSKGLVSLGMRLKGADGERFYSLTDHVLPKMLLGVWGGTSPNWLQFKCREDYITAWEKCPPLASILLSKARADINGRVSFYHAGTDDPVKVPYNGTAKQLKKLFDNPNPLQTWKQFRAQQKIYQGLFGFCPVLMIKPAGFNDPLATSHMWNIPPQYIKIHTTGKLLMQTTITDIIDKIEFSYNNKETELPVNDVLLLKEQSISLNNEIVPDSRIRPLSYPISNIAAAYEACNVIITERGALGILSNKDKDAGGSVAIGPKQKQELQDDFQRYGLSQEQWQVIITNANVEWQQMAMPIKDLMLLEILEDSTRQVADNLGYPHELLGNVKGVTFSNKKEAKVMLYQDTIIPEAEADFEIYNQYFRMSETGIEIYIDFSHVEALQKSETERAAALKSTAEAAVIMYTNNMITLNRMREMMNEPTVAGDDVYYSEKQQTNEETGEQQDPENQNQQET